MFITLTSPGLQRETEKEEPEENGRSGRAAG